MHRIGEVWLWKDGRIEVHVLGQDGYAEAAQSRVFPELELALMSSFFDRPTALQAVRAYRDALKSPAR